MIGARKRIHRPTRAHEAVSHAQSTKVLEFAVTNFGLANFLAHEWNCSFCCTPDELKGECISRCEHKIDSYAKIAEKFGFQFSRHDLQICERVNFAHRDTAVLEHFKMYADDKVAASAVAEVVFSDFVCRFSTASCERLGRGYGIRGIAGIARRNGGVSVGLNGVAEQIIGST
jgi:hypothetical protein